MGEVEALKSLKDEEYLRDDRRTQRKFKRAKARQKFKDCRRLVAMETPSLIMEQQTLFDEARRLLYGVPEAYSDGSGAASTTSDHNRIRRYSGQGSKMMTTGFVDTQVAENAHTPKSTSIDSSTKDAIDGITIKLETQDEANDPEMRSNSPTHILSLSSRLVTNPFYTHPSFR